jgi:hypothetical protein
VSDCTTWSALQIATPVLVILNSEPSRQDEVVAVFDALMPVVPVEDLRVIGTASWMRLMRTRGIRASQTLTTKIGREDLELNYFLENETALQWVAQQEPRTIIGSSPHNLYNEEVKHIFELRVTMLMSGAIFLAHTLPGKYVYLLETEDLFDRSGRSLKTDAYRQKTAALMADFHAQWQARGRPAEDDGPDYDDVADTIARHFGPAALAYDESSAIPIERVDITSEHVFVLRFVRSRLMRALRRLAPPAPAPPAPAPPSPPSRKS